MFHRASLVAVLAAGLVPGALAQTQPACPPGVASNKLICGIPQVYGANGLVVQANTTALGLFTSSFLSTSLQPLNSAIAKEAALLPLASPSSGFTYSWDQAAKTFVSSTDSYGPILGERAETIGRYKVYLGFDYQRFAFEGMDGISLKGLPVVLTQPDFTIPGTMRTCSVNGDNTTECSFIRDVIKTDNRLDLKIHQFTTFITFGVTNRIDLSLAIPIENVRLGFFSNATIVHNGDPSQFEHAFPTRPGCRAPCLTNTFSNVETASGIGDMSLRMKANVWKSPQKDAGSGSSAKGGERAALAVGLDIRLPSGDVENFLGSGTFGFRPFVVWSYRDLLDRISPHVFAGYETNGDSVIAGDPTTGTKDRLPGQLAYSGGADIWLTQRLTLALDIIGQEVFQARRTSVATLTAPGACQDLDCTITATPKVDPNLALSTGTYNITSGSIGAKVRPLSTLLVTGNVLLKMNNGGLRARAVPLFGLSYTF